jgi:hypothetical protein
MAMLHCDSMIAWRTFQGFDLLGNGDIIILQRGPFGSCDDEVVKGKVVPVLN